MQPVLVEYSLRYNRKGQLNAKGCALVQIRMYQSGQTRYQSTGVYLRPDEWSGRKNAPKDPLTARNIQNLIGELKTFESDWRDRHKAFRLKDFDHFGKAIPEVATRPVSFTDFFRDQLEAEKALRQSSWRTRRLTYEHFKAFRPDVRFDEMNYEVLEQFNFSLYRRNLQPNTIGKHHRHLRKYVVLAVKKRYLTPQDNPYLFFTMPKAPTRSGYLTWDELAKMEALTFGAEEKFLEKARDMFLMGCYTGLRFNDVYHLRPSHFHETPGGLELDFQARKTKKFGKKFLYLLFDGKPQTLARRYLTDDPARTLFKGMTNPKVNLALKELAQRAGINKPLCFKDSRDTFGTLMIALAPINLVKDEMQHSYLTTTQKYLHLNEEMKREALGKLKGKYGSGNA